MNMTILGTETDYPEDLSQVLEFTMVIKGLDSEGKVHYWAVASPDLQSIEALGMFRWGEMLITTDLFTEDDD